MERVDRVELRELDTELDSELDSELFLLKTWWAAALEEVDLGIGGDWNCSQKWSAESVEYSRSSVCSGVEVEIGLGSCSL